MSNREADEFIGGYERVSFVVKKLKSYLRIQTERIRSHTQVPAEPGNVFQASERGMVGWIVKTVERTLDFDINQRDHFMRTGLHW